jgi:GT2 family glycosyltransferase
MLDEIREETGYFDERFFFLVEDVDLSWRAQRIGWKALYYPKARCFHAGGSSGVSKKERRKLCFRNRRLLIKKNELKSALIMKAPFYLLYDLPRFVLLINLLNKRIKKGGKDAQGIFYFLGLCFLIAVYN